MTNKQKKYEYMKRSKQKVNIFKVKYKKTQKCSSCGSDDYRYLVYHHTNRNKKINSISKMKVIANIKIEIKKCIVLCENCHKEHHSEQSYFNIDHYNNLKTSSRYKYKMYYKNRDAINIHKENNGCLSCLNKNSKQLCFHHIDKSSKKESVSKMYHSSYNNLKNEISKCVILCNNCHLKYHHPDQHDNFKQRLDSIISYYRTGE